MTENIMLQETEGRSKETGDRRQNNNVGVADDSFLLLTPNSCILSFIAKHQPVAKGSVLEAMGKMIDDLVAEGTLVAEMRPTAGGEVLFYSVADRNGYPFLQEWLDRKLEPLPELSKPKPPLPIGKDKLKQLF